MCSFQRVVVNNEADLWIIIRLARSNDELGPMNLERTLPDPTNLILLPFARWEKESLHMACLLPPSQTFATTAGVTASRFLAEFQPPSSEVPITEPHNGWWRHSRCRQHRVERV